LLGDKIYGPDPHWHLRFRDDGWTESMANALLLPRHALHACELSFVPPNATERLSFASPLADDMMTYWDGLGDSLVHGPAMSSS
jgi:23S rRNA pseudouridine1911/1915/1917 synthase